MAFLEPALWTELAALQDAAEAEPVDELKGQVMDVAILIDFQNVRHERTVNFPEQPRLLLEALEHRRTLGKVWMQDLGGGHRPVRGVLSSVHFAKPAFANELQKLKTAELLRPGRIFRDVCRGGLQLR